MISVQKIRNRDDTLGFSCMPCLVYENVGKMIARKQCRNQPEKINVVQFIYRFNLCVTIAYFEFQWCNAILRSHES